MKKKSIVITIFIFLCCVIAIFFGVKNHHDHEVAIAKDRSESIAESRHRKHVKDRREKKKREVEKKKKQQAASSAQQYSNQGQQTVTPQNTQQSTGQLSQGETNRQRGYDPNGAPLLPGQDHAAGSNPDGSPDAWVQWQIDHQNDTTFPDETPFPNGGN